MNLVQDLARQIKASLPFAVLNEDPRNMFEKLVTYKSLSDIPPNIHIFNTTGNSTSDFIIKRENAPGGIGFSHPTLEIRAGKDVGEYNTLAFNTYAGGPLAKISTEVVAAGVYPNSIGKLHFAIQNGAGQQTMLTISENSTSEFAGNVGIGKSPSFALDVDGNINISAGNTLKIDGVDAVFSNWSTNGATIYRNSNVGIGDFSGSAPTEALDIDGSINLSAGNTLKIDGVAAVFSNWTVNGSDIYRLSNVGIGTDAPRYDLSVKGNNSTSVGIAVDNDSGSSTLDIAALGASYNAHGAAAGEVWFYSSKNINIGGATSDTNDIKFLGGGSEKMRITSSGNVGIGNSIPSVRLVVQKEETTTNEIAHIVNTAADWGATLVIKNYETNASAIRPASILLGTKGGSNWYQGILRNGGSPHGNVWALNTNIDTNVNPSQLSVTTDGRVGINKTVAEANRGLHVVTTSFTGPSGSVLMEDARTNANPSFNLRNDAQEWMIAIAGVRNNNFEIQDVTGSNTSRLAIDTSGNVGIGVLEPENKFHSRITAVGVPSGGYDARYKWLFEHDNEHYIGMYHKSTSFTGIRFFDETGGLDGAIDYYGSGITASGISRPGTVVISGKEGAQIREGAALISDFNAEEIWTYDTVRTKNYSFSNLTMSAGGKAWVKLFTTAHRGNITINFSAGAGNAQDWSVIELNLTYYALRSKITVKKSTYQVVLEAVRLIQQSDGANQEVWVKLNVDSNVLATQTYFSWNIDNWSPYDGLAINNTIQYTEPSLPGNAGWHKTLELNRTTHDLDRVATATSGGGIFKAGMEFPLMEGKALIMEVQPDVYWSLAWWEASDGSWWLLGRQGRHPDFVRADAEFYIPTGNILDVPAS